MAHSYNEIVNELIDKAGIHADEIFYYDGIPLEPVFEMYFQFCQENLVRKGYEYKIDPARIFIRNHRGVNAFAKTQNGYFIVGVNAGTLINLYYFFDNKDEMFDSPSLSFLNNLNTQLKTIDAPIFYLMQQFCNQFIYYHELGHLIQRSPELQTIIEEQYLWPSSKSVFSPERHVYEFDADIHGSEHIAFHVLQFWDKQGSGIRTAENLSHLISIAVAAIFSYFLKLMESYDKMYYAETCHPHPLVRLAYLIDSFIQTIEGNPKSNVQINSNKIILESFNILDVMFKADGSNQVELFVKMFWEEKDRINAYIREAMFPLVDKMPELAYNRLRQK